MSKWTKKPKKNKANQVWGIESDESSPAYGELVVKHIFLWKHPGGLSIKGNFLTGVLPHGCDVEIKRKKIVGGALHYLVSGSRRGDEVPETWLDHLTVEPDQTMKQEGWVKHTLLKDDPAY